MLNRVFKRLDWVVFAMVAVSLIGYGNSAASGQKASPEAARQQFARDYVAAIQSRDAVRVKALIHPEVLACKDFAEYFDAMKETVFAEQPAPGYKVTFTALPADSKPPILPPDKFKYPVQPTYELQINWSRTADGSSPVAIIQPIGQKDGAWFLVYACPNDEGIKMMREMTAQGREQKEHARTLASQLQEPLKSDLLALLKQGRKVDAIKKYQSASGTDLTTAVQVIKVLENASH
jgi:hypothetical protein